MHAFTRPPFVLILGTVLCLAVTPFPASASPASGAPGTQSSLPADVNAESRNRLSTPAPDPAGGPAAAAAAIRGAGTGLNARWESPVGRPLLELAILITAREHDAPFEWSLHEMEAVAVGLDPDVIDVVRNRESLSGLGDRDAVIIQAGREIYGEHHLSAETYRRAVDLFGEANFVDVVDLMARGADPQSACVETVRHILRRDPRPADQLSCFFIALDRQGRTGGAGTSGGFSYCVTTAESSRLIDAEVVTS